MQLRGGVIRDETLLRQLKDVQIADAAEKRISERQNHKRHSKYQARMLPREAHSSTALADSQLEAGQGPQQAVISVDPCHVLVSRKPQTQ